jgi:putative two-component system response regulator
VEVLIVDDSPINLAVFERLVQKGGNEASTFDAAEAGLDRCRQREPDLVVVDYMMPGMNGIQFIEQVRTFANCHEVPLVMVTADHDRGIRQRALEAGATDFLTKPVDHQEFTIRVRNMLRLRAAQKRLLDRAATLADEVSKATETIVATEQDTLMALARAAEYRDPETGAHVLRMAHYSRLIAERIGLPSAEQELVLRAAPLHDLGKIGTPDHILLKPGRLTPDEFEIMKQHATIGWEILKEHASPVLQAGADIAYSHHEKFGGGGYPRGLRGEAIPLHGRIVAVADVFDALTSERPYKHAWDVEQARAFLIEHTGAHFDPACAQAFLAGWEDVLAIRQRYRDE